MKRHTRAWLRAVSLVLVPSIGAGALLAAPVVPPKLAKRPGEVAAEEALAILLEYIANQREALVAIQRELVKRPGLVPEVGGDGEEDKARWIEDWLAEEGLPPAERIDCPDERVASKVRPSLILRHPAARRDRPTLWVVAYLDTTAPGNVGEWFGYPFSLRVDGDTMYGKGVQDNNDGIAAALLAVRALHRYHIVAPMNLGVLLVADEKQGSAYGFDYLVEKRPGLFSASDQFLVFSYGVETGDVVQIGEKTIVWLKISVQGRQSHAGFPDEGRNALVAGAELVAGLSRLRESFPGRDPLFNPPGSTFSPTRPEAPLTLANQIPDQFTFHLDMRLLPEHPLEEVMAAVEEQRKRIARNNGVEIRVEQTLLVPPTPITPPETPLVAAMLRNIEKEIGRRAKLIGIGGGTLAGRFRRLGLPAVVWRMAPFQEHSANESMSISSNLAEAALVIRLLFDEELAAAAGRNDPEPRKETTP